MPRIGGDKMSVKKDINDFLQNKVYNPLNTDSSPEKLRKAVELLKRAEKEIESLNESREEGALVGLPASE